MDENFEPINSQEELDARIGKRLERERDKIRSEYAGYEDYKSKAEAYDSKIAEYDQQIQSLNKTINEQKASIAKYETDSVKNRIASEFGIPAAMADRLHGTEEAEIRRDAEDMAKLFKTNAYPSRLHEEPPADSTDAAIKRMLAKIGK